MSNVGQGVLTVAGFAIGSFFGYPQLGFVLGSLAGQAIFPTKLPGLTGPRLNDTRTTTAQLGGPVMEVFGTEAVPGTVMYLGPLQEVSTTEEVGGKGGGGQDQTTFTYFQTLAVALCRAPAGGMGGLQRVYENGKLVYDIRPQQDYENAEQFSARVEQTAAYAETFVLYLGTEDQLPDPTIQADKGVDDTPPMRGLMYIVYPDRQLQQDQALRHPNFKFVVSEEDPIQEVVREYGVGYYPSWSSGDLPLPYARYDYDYGSYFAKYQALRDEEAAATGKSKYFGYTLGSDGAASKNPTNRQGLEGTPPPAHVDDDESFIYLHFNWSESPVKEGPYEAYDIDATIPDPPDIDGGNIFKYEQEPYPPGLFIHRRWIPGTSLDMSNTLWLLVSTGSNPFFSTTTEYPRGFQNSTNFGGVTHDIYQNWIGSDDRFVPIGRNEWPLDPVFRPDIRFQEYAAPSSPKFLNLANRGQVGVSPINPADPATQTIGPALIEGHDDDNEAFWTAAYDQAVLDGKIIAGLVYGVDYPAKRDFGWYRDIDYSYLGGAPVSIAHIVRRICAREDITDIDVDDLENRYVRGYVVSRVMNARDAIEPLRLVGYFDIVDSGCVLKFPVRGKAPGRTLAVTDLGAYEGDAEAPPAVTTRKAQDVELPRQIRFHYRAPSRDYEDGEQLSPTRLTTKATNDVDVECAVAIDDDHAAQAAEISWADAWAGRWAHTTTVDQSQLDLEPADVLLVPIDGREERVRIVAIDDKVSLLRTLEMVRDDDGSYVSRAIAAVPDRPPAQVAVYAPTALYLFDLPPLRVEDNDAGIYAAMRPTTTSSWSGAQIHRSTDAGTTYEAVASATNQATIGSVDEPLPEGPASWPDDEFDDDNVLTVRLLSGTFSSRPDAEVIEDGANNIAIGADGRWEIVGFGTATLIGENLWELSHLLRGRRGSEHNMGLSEPGDLAILISGPGIVRLPLPVGAIGGDYLYRAVTINARFTTATDQHYASGGEALLPFSPLDISGIRPSGDDVLFAWTRRDRLGQELAPIGPTPMSEAVEAWEIDIFSADSPDVVVRTLESNTAQVIYTAADQLTDFGGYPTTFIIAVYQLSAVMGRGTPGRGTVSTALNGLAGSTGMVFSSSAVGDTNSLGSVSLTFSQVANVSGQTGQAVNGLALGSTAQISGQTGQAVNGVSFTPAAFIAGGTLVGTSSLAFGTQAFIGGGAMVGSSSLAFGTQAVVSGQTAQAINGVVFNALASIGGQTGAGTSSIVFSASGDLTD